MSDAGDLIAFFKARLDDAEAKARDLLRTAQDVQLALKEPRLLGRAAPGACTAQLPAAAEI